MPNINLERIIADDATKAPRGSIRSREFRRMVAIVWPHKRHIILGLLAAVAAAALNAVSVGGIMPVLKILMEDEGLHGWVDRSVADVRLGAKLSTSDAQRGGGLRLEPGTVSIHEINDRSPLQQAGITKLGVIVSIDQQSPPFDQLVRRIAAASSSAIIELEFAPFLSPHEVKKFPVTLGDTPWHWRAIASIASLVPRETQPGDRLRTLVYLLAAVCVLVLLCNVARFFGEYHVSAGVFKGLMDLRRALYTKVLRLPMSFFTQGISDIVSRFVQDAQEIQRGLLALFGKFISEPLRALAILGVALWLDWRITLTMLVVGPMAVLIFMRVGHSIRNANRKLLLVYGRMIDALSTTLHAIGVVKAYTSEEAERERLWKIDEQALKHQLRIVKREAVLKPMLEVLGVVALSIATVWLGQKVIRRSIDPAEFGAIVFALAMLFDPIRKLADVYTRISRAAAGAERVFSVMDMAPESELLEGAVELPPLAERIEYHGVTFTYPQAARPALNGVNLIIQKGETIALVGPNGSGKTTLVNMLLRFFDPAEGAVLMDGVDLKRAKLQSLRRQISLVTQDAVIFEAALADNIAYGTPNAARDRIEAAARRAYADEFIRTKEKGYDTVAGERGSTLSGGQKQRLTIARAILRDAPILIFDEATSQIDSESELKIQEALKEFARGRTTIIVAHRLSTIRFAGRIVVMNHGGVVDSGTHAELLERCELYNTLCKTQLVE